MRRDIRVDVYYRSQYNAGYICCRMRRDIRVDIYYRSQYNSGYICCRILATFLIECRMLR
jgi:hypothetical protein